MSWSIESLKDFPASSLSAYCRIRSISLKNSKSSFAEPMIAPAPACIWWSSCIIAGKATVSGCKCASLSVSSTQSISIPGCGTLWKKLPFEPRPAIPVEIIYCWFPWFSWLCVFVSVRNCWGWTNSEEPLMRCRLSIYWIFWFRSSACLSIGYGRTYDIGWSFYIRPF